MQAWYSAYIAGLVLCVHACLVLCLHCIILTLFSASCHPQSRRAVYSTSCPCVLHADWCIQSDALIVCRLQAEIAIRGPISCTIGCPATLENCKNGDQSPCLIGIVRLNIPAQGDPVQSKPSLWGWG